jgi:hypothetical protein
LVGDVNDGLGDFIALANPEAFTESPSLPNTLRILVLVEASNTSFRLSIRVLSPEPVMSIFSNASGFAKISGVETEGSITYDVYTHTSANTDANAALWIQQDIGSDKIYLWCYYSQKS